MLYSYIIKADGLNGLVKDFDMIHTTDELIIAIGRGIIHTGVLVLKYRKVNLSKFRRIKDLFVNFLVTQFE